MFHTRARAFYRRLLTWGALVVWGVIAITYKLACPIAQQNGLGARIVSSAVFLTVGIGLIVHVRRALLRELREARKVASAAQSMTTSTYEAKLRAAQAEIEQDEIGYTIDEVAELLGASQLHGDSDKISSAAIAAEGLTGVFTSLGPPPPGLVNKYGDGGSGSDDGVGAGPRGRNV